VFSKRICLEGSAFTLWVKIRKQAVQRNPQALCRSSSPPVFTAVILVRGAIDPIDDEVRPSLGTIYLQFSGCAQDLFRDSFKPKVTSSDLFLDVEVERFYRLPVIPGVVSIVSSTQIPPSMLLRHLKDALAQDMIRPVATGGRDIQVLWPPEHIDGPERSALRLYSMMQDLQDTLPAEALCRGKTGRP